MHVWFRWIAYINPAFYSFGAVMGSEFGNIELSCQEPQYVPFGPGYTDDNYRSCTVAGTPAGSSIISGEAYIQAQYKFSHDHVWRNVGIVIGFWVFFVIMTAVGFELAEDRDTGSRLLYKRGAKKQLIEDYLDEEKAVRSQQSQSTLSAEEGKSLGEQSFFTFKNLSYFVQHQGSEKQLLHEVSGFVKPGQLVALMGSSGAGKTTYVSIST